MKCADCKFWVIDPSETDPMETFSGDNQGGECHRRAPAPISAMVHIAAMLTARYNPEMAFEDLSEAQAYWTSRGTAWPVVNAKDFCGEYVVKREMVF